MKVLDQVTRRGGRALNEDRLGHTTNLAWVIDGATDLEHDAFLPADTDVQWLVDRLSELLSSTTPSARQDLERLLHTMSARVADDLSRLGFPVDRIHPTCSIGLSLVTSDQVRLARVGDVTCVAVGAGTQELSTPFFDRREARAIGLARAGEPRQGRSGILERRQQYIEGRLEESVFSGHPRARLKVRSLAIDRRSVDHVLLCTDGFARAVVDYHLYPDWNALLSSTLTAGLDATVRRVREHESTYQRSEAITAAHFKRSDDATAMIIDVSSPTHAEG